TLMTQIGYKNLIEAEDGQEALEFLQENQDIGLILCDWDMPRMDGLELLHHIRNDDTLAETPFIMVTAQDSKEQIIVAAKAKVSQYIVKPFTAQALREKINKVLHT
ncbi:MAG: response regulator, partial [Desulfobulbaceae bacterium]|nr:response regulator [Desulfobulbaceae bacterium]